MVLFTHFYGGESKFEKTIYKNKFSKIILLKFNFKFSGGTPILFGMILNIGNSSNYLLVIPRTLSKKFKESSDRWYFKFSVIESAVEIIIAAGYFASIVSWLN
jgi:hypothetical protein